MYSGHYGLDSDKLLYKCDQVYKAQDIKDMHDIQNIFQMDEQCPTNEWPEPVKACYINRRWSS